MNKKLHRLLLAYKRKYDWNLHAREAQRIPEGPWRQWLIMAGRGFGKTRTGAETIRRWVETKAAKHIALIGQNLCEAQAVMIEGKSGLLSVSPYPKPHFDATKRTLTWSSGAMARLYSGDSFESLRGPQFDAVWIDELAKFRYPRELWEQVQLTLRLGPHPRCIITTTPRPMPLLEELIEDPLTFVTRGTTFDNEKNLSETFLEHIKQRFSSSKLGAQELYGELLAEQEGALWNRDMIRYRMTEESDWKRVVIAIDPATTYHEKSDETGIVVAAKCHDDTYTVIADLTGRLSPAQWGNVVVEAFHTFRADRVIAEVNKGGDLVERIITSIDGNIPYRPVRAMRGKITRAEPIAALYEKGLVFHERPLRDLENQLCHYVAGGSHSPDRLDAMVWALTELSGNANGPFVWMA